MKTTVEVGPDGSCRVVATTAIEAGEVVFRLNGAITHIADRHSVQISENTHLAPEEPIRDEDGSCRFPWMYTNHSCEPSASVSGREMVALRTITRDEEVTFDYDTTEWDMAEPFNCHCEHACCRGRIRGYRHLTSDQRQRISATTSPYLKTLAAAEIVSAGRVD